MRKCIRCEFEMRENYDVKVEGGAYGLKLRNRAYSRIIWGRFMLQFALNVGILNFIWGILTS